jgi:two-component system, sensor histidine kinase and response regulator
MKSPGGKMDKNDTGPLFDMTLALTHVDGDRELLAELSAMFLEDYPHMLREAEESIKTGNPRNLERLAHTLKGRLAFFGIHDMIGPVMELESMGRKNDLSNAAELLLHVEKELKSLLEEFERSLKRLSGK